MKTNDFLRDNIFSFGGGVQSTFILYLIWRGWMQAPEFIFHANMGLPEKYLEDYRKAVTDPMIADICERHGTKFVESDLDFQGAVEKKVITPFWFANDAGKPSLSTRRSCTFDYKVKPSNKLIPRRGWSRMVLGISSDEIKRVRDTEELSHSRMRENYYPLIEMGLFRDDCIALLKGWGVPTPQKSACDFCPFSSKKRLVGNLAIDPTLHERIKYIEARWHENEKHAHKFLTSFLGELPTQEQAQEMAGAYATQVENSGACGVCEF